MIRIAKFTDSAGVEWLPDVTQFPLWEKFEQGRCTLFERNLIRLYGAVADRENYYQENAPTAFGDVKHERMAGKVWGILAAMEAEEDFYTSASEIIFTKGNRRLLVVDKLERTAQYREAVKDNKEILAAVFG